MPPRHALRIAACVAGIALAAVACDPLTPSAGATPGAVASAGASAGQPFVKWPAPSDPLQRATAAGLVPQTVEHLAFHVHAHLDVFIDGTRVVVPEGVGINIADPGVKPFTLPDGSPSYGGITGCGQPCISPLHTHDQTCILHTESESENANSLGQFFTEWGVPLSQSCVGEYCTPGQPIAIYLNGARFSGDPTTIKLADLLEIAIVIGKPPAVIPAVGDFTGA